MEWRIERIYRLENRENPWSGGYRDSNEKRIEKIYGVEDRKNL